MSVALAAGFGALFAWVMFLDPLVGALMGQETTGITDSWVTPLPMVLLVDAAAVTGPSHIEPANAATKVQPITVTDVVVLRMSHCAPRGSPSDEGRLTT